jgi:hypothetical protein
MDPKTDIMFKNEQINFYSTRKYIDMLETLFGWLQFDDRLAEDYKGFPYKQKHMSKKKRRRRKKGPKRGAYVRP